MGLTRHTGQAKSRHTYIGCMQPPLFAAQIWNSWKSRRRDASCCTCTQNGAAAGAYHVSEHFYLLFQHQTTKKLSRTLNGLFGPPGTYSFLRQLGGRVALLAPDSRAQRSTHRIISPEAYEQIFARWPPHPANSTEAFPAVLSNSATLLWVLVAVHACVWVLAAKPHAWAGPACSQCLLILPEQAGGTAAQRATLGRRAHSAGGVPQAADERGGTVPDRQLGAPEGRAPKDRPGRRHPGQVGAASTFRARCIRNPTECMQPMR